MFDHVVTCLCQAVSVRVPHPPEKFTVCHCQTCRRWSGSVLMSTNGGAHLQFEGEEHVGRYSSSEWAERGFCRRCGTHLFYRLKKSDYYFLMLGLFDDSILPKFEMQDFIDQKPNYYAFADQTKTTTRAQAFAMLHAYLERP